MYATCVSKIVRLQFPAKIVVIVSYTLKTLACANERLFHMC